MIVLMLLAATSLDKVVDFMTFRKWKWLHRLIYVGGVLAIIHVWTIGTHLSYRNLQLAAFAALVILGTLEAFRVSTLIGQKYLESRFQTVVLFLSIVTAIVALTAMLPYTVQNYHGRHTSSQHEDH